LIWKTNAHGSPEARELLDGVFDVGWWISNLETMVARSAWPKFLIMAK